MMKRKIGKIMGLAFLLCCGLLAVKGEARAATTVKTAQGLFATLSVYGGAELDGNTVKLQKDVAISDYLYLALDENVVLDLNNHSIRFDSSKGFAVYGNADENGNKYGLVLKNSGGDEKKAVISTNGAFGTWDEICTLKIATSVNIENITIENNAIGGSETPALIQQDSKLTYLNMKNCMLKNVKGPCLYAKYGDINLENCQGTSGGKWATILLENQCATKITGSSFRNTGTGAAVSISSDAGAGELDASLFMSDVMLTGEKKTFSVAGSRAVVSLQRAVFEVKEEGANPVAIENGELVLSDFIDRTVYGIVNSAKVTKIVYRVEVAKPAVSKLTVGKKKLTVKASKKPSVYGGSGFQISYRQKGKKSWKTISTTSQSKVLKSLKKGKKYQVKIRAYYTAGNQKYYSSWSATKTSKKIK